MKFELCWLSVKRSIRWTLNLFWHNIVAKGGFLLVGKGLYDSVGSRNME